MSLGPRLAHGQKLTMGFCQKLTTPPLALSVSVSYTKQRAKALIATSVFHIDSSSGDPEAVTLRTAHGYRGP